MQVNGISRITILPKEATNIQLASDHHHEALLALIDAQKLGSGGIDEFIFEFTHRTLKTFGLAAAQIWRKDNQWDCLADSRCRTQDATSYPSPSESLDCELAARTLDCHVASQADIPDTILRLIMPAGRSWSAEERALTSAYVTILGNTITTSHLLSTIESLSNAKILADVANRAKTDFLANMSHELRTPLNAIIGFSEILAQEYFGAHNAPQYKEYAQDILLSGQHLLALINDILDLSQIESGRHQLREEYVKLDELIQAATRFVREQAHTKKHDLNILGVRGLSLFAEARAIKQILVNLLSNAIKFTPPNGSITLAVSVDDTIRISVCDTGYGITPDQLSNLFQPFSRGDGNTKPAEEGAGLGLVISRKLARLHEGDLSLKSEIGVGTTATFTLPVKRLAGDLENVMPWDIL